MQSSQEVIMSFMEVVGFGHGEVDSLFVVSDSFGSCHEISPIMTFHVPSGRSLTFP